MPTPPAERQIDVEGVAIVTGGDQVVVVKRSDHRRQVARSSLIVSVKQQQAVASGCLDTDIDGLLLAWPCTGVHDSKRRKTIDVRPGHVNRGVDGAIVGDQPFPGALPSLPLDS